MKKYLLVLLLAFTATAGQAQEFFYEAEFVNRYLWRGMKNGNASFQPAVGIEWDNLTFTVWGSTEFKKRNNEIDLLLEYRIRNLNFVLNNYFFHEEGERFQYFDFRPHTSGHQFEIGAEYTISEKLPLQLSWYTTFAGNDYTEADNRAWSTYIEAAYGWEWIGCDFTAEAGVTPWQGMYGEGFRLVNLGASVGKTWELTERLSSTLSGKLVYNPAEKDVYFIVGVGMAF